MVTSCGDKLEGGWERDDVQRTAQRYDTSMTVAANMLGLRLLLLAAVAMGARALPPQTNRRRVAKKRGTGRKYSQLCVV